VKKYIAVLLMLVLLAMPGTQGLLAQDYSENSLQNELTLPQIEASQEQAADELGELPDEQEQFTGEQEEAPDGQEIPDEQKEHPDEQVEVQDDQGELPDEQELTTPYDDVRTEALIIDPPSFDKKSLSLEEKNEEIDKVLREVSANANVTESVYSTKSCCSNCNECPVYIWTASDIYNIRDNLNGYYVQMADIDLSAYPNWEPINMFNGTYDGNGFNVTNLTISRSTEDRIGLFGDLSGTTCSLQNINLKNISVSGRQCVGGLVGFTSESTVINNCSVTGLVKGEDAFIGGLAGVNAGLIIQCKVTGRYIDGFWGVGGLVGFNTTNGIIFQSHTIISVYGDDPYITYSGGLAGINGGSIRNCYSLAGVVMAPSYSGGLVGHMVTDGYVRSCYAAKYVNCYSNSGGLVGNSALGTVSDSYYDIEIADQYDTGKGEPRTTAQMKQQSTYVDWNFADIWGINPDTNLGYPYLKSPSEESIPVIVIPGIMGSELYAAEDDYLCWPNIFHINDGLRRLHVNEYGVSDEDITVGGLVGLPDYYSEMIAQLRTAGFKVEEFPYDWRMDNNINVDRLEDKINSTLQKYNADKVDIVAHSMGGLVSKAYLNKYARANKVRKLVTIGTPHLGAPKMFGVWKTSELEPGAFISIDALIDCDTVKYITRNFSSIYQLLPSKDYFSYGGAYYEEGFDTNGDGLINGRIYNYSDMKDWYDKRYNNSEYNDLNWNMLNNAEAFHDVLDKIIITDNSLVEGYMIASDRQATPVLLRDYIGSLGIKHENKVEKLEAGDGTVPTVSATNGQIQHSQIFYVNDGTHGELLKLSPVIQKTIHILNGDFNTPVEGIRSGVPAELDGYYVYAACPVDLYVTDSEGQVADPETWGTSIINYWITGESKHAFIHDDNFEIDLKGTGQGIADLVIEKYENGEKTERYSYLAIPTAEGSDVRLTVSGTPQNLLIDTDGDGTYETTAAPDNVASGAALEDTTGPVVTSDLNGAYFNQDVIVNISAHDQSGIEKIMYSVNNGSWSELVGGSLTFNQEGEYQTSVCALDKAGNWSEPLEFTICLDKTAPVIITNFADGIEIERFSSFTISNSADDQLSGIEQLSTTLDGQIIANEGDIDTEALSFGNHTIIITAVDKAGNTTIRHITIKITASMSTVGKLVDRYYQSGEINNTIVYRGLKELLAHDITLLPFMLKVKAVRGIHITKPAADKLLDYCEWIIKDKYSCKL
jgi:pimeloyl-ACP methyl ester carboxylesterase